MRVCVDSMKQATLLTFASIAVILITGCVQIQSDVTTFHSFPVGASPTGTIAFVPYKGVPNDLEFQQYASQIQGMLSQKGLTPASSQVSADFIGAFYYGIDSGKTETSAVPLYGQTSGGSTFTSGNIYSGGQTASYSGSSFTTPTYGFTVVVPVTSERYTRIAELSIYNRKTGQEIWKGRNKSSGSSGEIARVLPTMITALLKDFPGQSGKTRFISLPLAH